MPPSLRALLNRAIDYAGLFPPANLALDPALRNYAEYIRLPDAWMLGAFILPVAEFDAAARNLSAFDEKYPLRISALGAKTDNADSFLKSLSAAMESIAAFRASARGWAVIEQYEMPLSSPVSSDLLKAIRAILADSNLKTFWEVPTNGAVRAIDLIGENNSATSASNLGFKLRTGGISAEAFPTSAQIAAVLRAAAKTCVPIKFTAGLHHPVRLFHESVQTKMHGFLNVLGAGVLAAEHDWSEEQIAQMLDDEDAASFSFNDEFFSWREWKIPTESIAARRGLVTSLGSCSFDEPRDDLRALKLM